MVFRSIGELAFELLAELENGTERSAGKRAHPPVAPGEPGRGGDQQSRREGDAMPVAFAQGGGGTAAQTELGKMGEPKPPRVGQEDNQTKGRRPGGLAVLSYREHMPPALRLVSSRCMDRASPTRRPTVARSIHLRLVWDAGHDTAPKARRRWSSTKAAATSVIPAMKP
jgi:hypothetical protein